MSREKKTKKPEDRIISKEDGMRSKKNDKREESDEVTENKGINGMTKEK